MDLNIYTHRVIAGNSPCKLLLIYYYTNGTSAKCASARLITVYSYVAIQVIDGFDTFGYARLAGPLDIRQEKV